MKRITLTLALYLLVGCDREVNHTSPELVYWREMVIFRGSEDSVYEALDEDGSVTGAEVFEYIYENRGSHYDGDAMIQTAHALLCLADDPVPHLEQVLKDSNPHRRAYAALTAGFIADIRLDSGVRSLVSDDSALGEFRGDWFWNSVGEVATEALELMGEGGWFKGKLPGELPGTQWLQKTSPEA